MELQFRYDNHKSPHGDDCPKELNYLYVRVDEYKIYDLAEDKAKKWPIKDRS